MPPIDVYIYLHTDGTVPLVDWLKQLPKKAQDKCLAWVDLLAEQGHEIRRPIADYLDDGIYELRASFNHQQHRMLYFFHQGYAVLTNGVTKERVVPQKAIDLAKQYRAQFIKNPKKHIYTGEL